MGKPSKDYAVPLWEKANLTVYEAAAYSGIGADKLRELSDREDCEFVLWNGTKRLIQSNNQRCDSQNRIVVPNGGYRYPKAKRK